MKQLFQGTLLKIGKQGFAQLPGSHPCSHPGSRGYRASCLNCSLGKGNVESCREPRGLASECRRIREESPTPTTGLPPPRSPPAGFVQFH